MTSPFPYFGGKSSVASLVWDHLGNPPNYIEPFFGSGAVLLARPDEPAIETINDKDGFVANFWRALKADPEQVAAHADNPVNENDLHARHIWLVNQAAGMVPKLEGDPDWFDAKIAGWWVWGMACWIGSGFCSGEGPWQSVDGQLVHLGGAGQGVNRQLVHLGDAGRGVNRKRVQLVHRGKGVKGAERRDNLQDYFTALADRLRNVRVCCGDWTRVCGTTPTFKNGLTGVFLDPPYSHKERHNGCYRVEMPCADAVREWAIDMGKRPDMRIALCGYGGEHVMPEDWEEVAWKARGGYAGQGDGSNRNAHRERIWFSPACLRPAKIMQIELLEVSQ